MKYLPKKKMGRLGTCPVIMTAGEAIILPRTLSSVEKPEQPLFTIPI